MRGVIVDRVRTEQVPIAEVATAAGISVRTAYKWLARYRVEGRPGLEDRSSRPHNQPRRTSTRKVARILAARRAGLTAWAIAVRTQVPRSTVAVVLARASLGRLKQLEPRPPVQRYEWKAVGDMIHIDIKPLARIVKVGHRIHGDRAHKAKGGGYEFAHVAVDDYSRVAYVEVLPNQRATTTAGFLERMLRWFAQRGVVVRRVLTDNGSGYRSHLYAAAALRHAVRLKHSRPYRPQTNGKAERFIQTLAREWAYGASYATSSRRTRALRPWLRHYNTARPHTALNYQPPCARFPKAAK
jgi:transposase InsO family protein